MDLVYAVLIASAPASYLAVGMVSSSWANRQVLSMRRIVTAVSTGTLVTAFAAALILGIRGPLDTGYQPANTASPIGLGVYFDSLAAVFLLLISFIGFIVTRFSLRYLDGEPTQGRFLRWISFTLGSALLLIISQNLVMLTGAWMLTSFGLHQLLTHYPDRPGATLAARKKFVISRLGDTMLVAALALTYYIFGTFEYGQIFAAAKTSTDELVDGHWLLPLIGTLFVFGAMTKSAQFPFHSWLPDTMETPTPVSALMHAGIINAGGFLVIRLSPLVSHSHLALDLLAFIGGLTAIFGAVVMLTQTSVKRSLAYSTIAQMGFMMLQCGLGAFSAALLHIVAHSLYKAYAFLSSGSVLETAARIQQVPPAFTSIPRSLAALVVSAIVAAGSCWTAAWVCGIQAGSKPGTLLLAWILIVAMTHLLWKSFAAGSARVALAGVAGAVAASFSYYASYLLMDKVLAASVSHHLILPSLFDTALIILMATGFSAVLALQVCLVNSKHSRLLQSLYVHASNGFYFDITAQKLTVKLWKQFSHVK